MNLFSNWLSYVLLYLVLATAFTQFYKVTTKTLKKAGALTVLLEMTAGLTALQKTIRKRRKNCCRFIY